MITLQNIILVQTSNLNNQNEKFCFSKKKINKFDIKSLSLPGDKSLSIRFIIFASLANGKSKAYNLLNSEDVKKYNQMFQ